MKDKITTFIFLGFIVGVFILNIITPDTDISYSERRDLSELPSISLEGIYSGEFTDDFEEYALDQIIFREKFREIKAFVDFNIFNKADNNDIYVIGDQVFKMEYPLNTDLVYSLTEYMKEIEETYFEDNNVFFSIIPDKNYFVAEDAGYLSIDYKELESIMVDNLESMTYIDIMDALTIDDYYRTDTHWRQEMLDPVLAVLGESMGFDTNFDEIEYELESYYPFYGVYYGQSALTLKPDTLYYRTNETIENAIVYNYVIENGTVPTEVYQKENLGGMDSYDVFLEGNSPIIIIENPENTSGKELVVFRDSFGSSIAPLLIEEYSKITLFDTRTISYTMIGEYVEFVDQDVLFLYSTLVINNSNILK